MLQQANCDIIIRQRSNNLEAYKLIQLSNTFYNTLIFTTPILAFICNETRKFNLLPDIFRDDVNHNVLSNTHTTMHMASSATLYSLVTLQKILEKQN